MNNLENNYENVCKKIKYDFCNTNLLHQAFIRSSYAKENGTEDNEILELIGDSILGFIVTKMIFECFGRMIDDINDNEAMCRSKGKFSLAYNLNEGDITELKKNLLSNKFLASKMDELEFHKMLYLGKNDINNKVWENEKAKADLLEAIIGAVAIDSKWDLVILERLVKTLTDITETKIESIWLTIKNNSDNLSDKIKEVDAVTVLKELSDKGRCKPPKYLYEEDNNEDNNHIWKCTCILDNCKTERFITEGQSKVINITCIAEANTKKDAKKKAANAVLKKFRVD